MTGAWGGSRLGGRIRATLREAGRPAVRAGVAAGAAAGLLSCVSPADPSAYGYFETPAARDPWSTPIVRWQTRVREHERSPLVPPVSLGPDAASDPTDSLSSAFARFQGERKRALVAEVTRWIQDQARSHFVPDGGVDRWATFEEVLATDGDDCDGLALVAYEMLRGFGFGEGELYQAIVRRSHDNLHHMVTLWFEDRRDPWVVDPTGVMATEPVRMSQRPGWQPLKLFTENEEYTARALGGAAPPR